MVRVDAVSSRRGNPPLLRRVNLTVNAGEAVAIIGDEGAGPDTLVRLVATLERPSSGQIDVCGIDAVAQPFAVRSRVFLAGIPEDVLGFDDMSVAEHLHFIAASRERSRRRAAEGLELLTELGIRPDAMVSALGPGERALLELAAAVAAEPDVLLFAESSHLTLSSTVAVRDTVISKAQARGAAVLAALKLNGSNSGPWSTRLLLRDGELRACDHGGQA